MLQHPSLAWHRAPIRRVVGIIAQLLPQAPDQRGQQGRQSPAILLLDIQADFLGQGLPRQDLPDVLSKAAQEAIFQRGEFEFLRPIGSSGRAE